MPPHHSSSSDALQIDIPPSSYAPGDTIIGHLVRKTPIVAPEATLTVSFVGRAKVKLVYNRQNSKSVYRDEAQFVNHLTTVFQGPLHLAEGSAEPLIWPIYVNIPLEPHETSRRGRDQGCSLLPLNQDHPSHHILPGTFHSEDHSFGNPKSSCFVEYYLVANLRYQVGGKFKSYEAMLPIPVRTPVFDTTKLNIWGMLQDSRRVYSQRLLPGMEDAKLSVKQQMQKFFSTSSVPCLNYTVRLTVPTAIQLNNPQPLQIRLEVVPNNEATSDSIKDAPQTIRVQSVSMTLRPFTRCIAAGSFITSQYSNEYRDKDDLGLQYAFTKSKEPVHIVTGKTNEPVDIGNMFQLTLTPTGLVSSSGPLTYPGAVCIHPDFITYNIERRHTVDYHVFLTIAGDKQEHKLAGARTEILPPAQ